MLFGDNESDDGNSLILQSLDKPCVKFVRQIQELSQTKLENEKKGGDIFQALKYAVENMNEHCGKKKYNKRIFLFTNGAGKTSWKVENLQRLLKIMRESSIKLNVIPIDFMTSYDVNDNILEGEVMESEEHQHNAELLMALKGM